MRVSGRAKFPVYYERKKRLSRVDSCACDDVAEFARMICLVITVKWAAILFKALKNSQIHIVEPLCVHWTRSNKFEPVGPGENPVAIRPLMS